MSLSIAITAVPERLDLARNLARSLNYYPSKLFVDTNKRGPWWGTTLPAWVWGKDQSATHVLVLQEDTLACPNFIQLIEGAIAAKPEDCISIYGGIADKPIFDKGVKANSAWVRRSWGLTAQGIVLPRIFIGPFLLWQTKHIKPEAFKNVDNRLSLWLHSIGKNFWQTVPELIEHTGGERSALGYNSPTKRSYMLADGSPIDWGRGADGSCVSLGSDKYIQEWKSKWQI